MKIARSKEISKKVRLEGSEFENLKRKKLNYSLKFGTIEVEGNRLNEV